MTDRIKLNANTLTVNGKRSGIEVDGGPWASGVPSELIKIRCKRGAFPAGFREALTVSNNSNRQEDYFEANTIRLLPGDKLYEEARNIAK